MLDTEAPVLITGGAGFIGSHLTDRLLAEGRTVRVLDDLSTGHAENLSNEARDTLIEGDVADEAGLRTAVEGCAAIVHLAAVASVQASIDDPVRTHRTNLEGTIRVLEAAKRAGVPRVVYASSAAVYGEATDLPVSEEAPKRPLSPYAADKLAGEHYLAHYHRQGWLSAVAFRFFNVYGPRQDPSSPYSGVISIFAKRAREARPVTVFGDGQQTRDFIYVRDVAEALLAALGWEREPELPVVNVGRGEAVSLLELLSAIEHAMGRRVERSFDEARAGDIRHSRADVRRLRERLGSPDFTPLDQGLRETLAG